MNKEQGNKITVELTHVSVVMKQTNHQTGKSNSIDLMRLILQETKDVNSIVGYKTSRRQPVYATVIDSRYGKYADFVTIIMDFELSAELYERDLCQLDFGSHRIELGAAQ